MDSTETQNCWSWPGPLEIILSTPPAQWRFSYSRLLTVMSSQVFIIFSDGDSITSLGNLFQSSITLMEEKKKGRKKKFFFLSLGRIFYISDSFHCLLFHWAPLGRVWIYLLYSFLSSTHSWVCHLLRDQGEADWTVVLWIFLPAILNTGVIFAYFQSSGTYPDSHDLWKIIKWHCPSPSALVGALHHML